MCGFHHGGLEGQRMAIADRSRFELLQLESRIAEADMGFGIVRPQLDSAPKETRGRVEPSASQQDIAQKAKHLGPIRIMGQQFPCQSFGLYQIAGLRPAGDFGNAVVNRHG
jgi:hypothetical protein